jgi:hypothetical protein
MQHLRSCAALISVQSSLDKIDSAKVKITDDDERSIEMCLSRRMDDIIESIKYCAKLCDSYQRRHVAGEHLVFLISCSF